MNKAAPFVSSRNRYQMGHVNVPETNKQHTKEDLWTPRKTETIGGGEETESDNWTRDNKASLVGQTQACPESLITNTGDLK